nr:ABC transporter ATP-binding protein [Candidatus Levybacteria bacterium]
MNPKGNGLGRSMRSFTQDDSVKNRKISSGTKKRILAFAAPYKKLLIFFFLMVILSAAIGAVNPLIFREIINKGILGQNANIVIQFALIIAGLAVVDAITSLIQRYFSSRIGEGLIYDMRTQVFAHIQKMPIAFYMRTQTGSLVSRLDNDVQGAQQAFTSVLSTVVGNVISVILVLIAMFILSWQLTLVSLLMLPLFVLPA